MEVDLIILFSTHTTLDLTKTKFSLVWWVNPVRQLSTTQLPDDSPLSEMGEENWKDKSKKTPGSQ